MPAAVKPVVEMVSDCPPHTGHLGYRQIQDWMNTSAELPASTLKENVSTMVISLSGVADDWATIERSHSGCAAVSRNCAVYW